MLFQLPLPVYPAPLIFQLRPLVKKYQVAQEVISFPVRCYGKPNELLANAVPTIAHAGEMLVFTKVIAPSSSLSMCAQWWALGLHYFLTLFIEEYFSTLQKQFYSLNKLIHCFLLMYKC